MYDMIKYFRQGFENTNKNIAFVSILFLIDLLLIALSGILSLDWVSDRTSARVIVLHYDLFKIARAAPEFLKLAVEIFVISGSIAAAGQFIQSGHIKMEAFFKNGFKCYLRFCLLTLIWFLTAVVPAFAAALVLVFYFSGTLNPASAVLIAATVIFLLIMMSLFFFAPFILVLENAGAIEAIRKSFAIAKKNFRILLSFIGIYFLITLVLYIASALVVGTYLGAVEMATHSAKIGQFAKFSIEALFSFAARYIYVAGIFATAFFYYKVKGSDEKQL